MEKRYFQLETIILGKVSCLIWCKSNLTDNEQMKMKKKWKKMKKIKKLKKWIKRIWSINKKQGKWTNKKLQSYFGKLNLFGLKFGTNWNINCFPEWNWTICFWKSQFWLFLEKRRFQLRTIILENVSRLIWSKSNLTINKNRKRMHKKESQHKTQSLINIA